MALVQNRDHYHEMIQKTIDECSYKFYQIIPDLNFKCTCVHHPTKQADPECPKCLGTGHRITIKMIYGAANDEMKGSTSLGLESSRIIKEYFVSKRFEIHPDDMFIDNDDVYYVFRIEKLRGLKGTHTHNEVTCVKRTNDSKKALANFNKIIAKHKKK